MEFTFEYSHNSVLNSFSDNSRNGRCGGGGARAGLWEEQAEIITTPRVIGRFARNLVCKFIVVSCDCSFAFVFLHAIFLALLPKAHFYLEGYQK